MPQLRVFLTEMPENQPVVLSPVLTDEQVKDALDRFADGVGGVGVIRLDWGAFHAGRVIAVAVAD